MSDILMSYKKAEIFFYRCCLMSGQGLTRQQFFGFKTKFIGPVIHQYENSK